MKKRQQKNENIDIYKYDNESYLKNPLLKFRMPNVREHRHYTLLKMKAGQVLDTFK